MVNRAFKKEKIKTKYGNGANIIYVVLLGMLVLGCCISPNFRTFSNFSNLMSQSAIVGVLAIGQTIVLITGGFDLAQGALLALTSVILAILIPVNTVLAFAAALLCMIVFGIINSFFVNKGISPFVVTLGTQGIARTLALWWSNEESVNIEWIGIKFLAHRTLLGIPISVYLWIILSILFSVFLKKMVIGRHIYAIGGNAESSRLSGVDVEKTRCCAYIISAACVFAAGVIYTSRLTVGVPDKALGYEMDSLSCSIIGGTALTGGVGTLQGTFAGVLIFSIITNFLNLMGISTYWQKVIKGCIILLAVFFSVRASHKEVKS